MKESLRYILLLLLLLFLPGLAGAQNMIDDFWRGYLEMWSEHYDQEEMPDDVIERLQELLEQPVNLNDTTQEQLLELPFVSPQQVLALKAYINQTGPLYSVAELRLVYGFDSTTVELLAPFVVALPAMEEKIPSLKELVTQGHHNVVIGMSHTLEPAEGYVDSSYMGDPFRYYLRYYYKYKDNVHLQFSADQDAGESLDWSKTQRGFDFYGFHLLVGNIGRVKRAVVGRYQLQFGQGLTLWSGFSPWSDFVSATWRYGQGIRPASAFCEYGMLQGAASTVAITRHLELTAYYSNVNRDATLRSDTTENGMPLIRSIYSSGYHRTQTEQGKKSQLNEQLYGANLHYRCEHLSIEATAYRVVYDRTILPYPYLYNYFEFSGKENLVAGADVSYRLRRSIWFGEVSFSQNGGAAQLLGLQFSPNNNNHLSVLWRHYGEKYQNSYATAFGQSSNVQNENGVFMAYSLMLPWHLTMALSADFFRWPGLRYQLLSPSVGAEYRLRLCKDIGSQGNISLQYRYKNKGNNVGGTRTYIVEQTVKQQLQASLCRQVGNHWRFATRVAVTDFYGEVSGRTFPGKGDEPHTLSKTESARGTEAGASGKKQGILMLQEATYTLPIKERSLRCSLRMAYFDARDYDARLYALENDFVYETSTMVYYGKGFRAACLWRYDVNEDMTLCLKYGITYYPGEESIGSGDAKISTNHRQEVKAQLRLRF